MSTSKYHILAIVQSTELILVSFEQEFFPLQQGGGNSKSITWDLLPRTATFFKFVNEIPISSNFSKLIQYKDATLQKKNDIFRICKN